MDCFQIFFSLVEYKILIFQIVVIYAYLYMSLTLYIGYTRSGFLVIFSVRPLFTLYFTVREILRGNVVEIFSFSLSSPFHSLSHTLSEVEHTLLKSVINNYLLSTKLFAGISEKPISRNIWRYSVRTLITK